MGRMKSILVTEEMHGRIVDLVKDIGIKTDRFVSIPNVVGRAVQALEDAHANNAWLSPAEAAPVYEERLEREVVRAVIGTMRAFHPGVPVEVAVNRKRDSITITAQGESVELWTTDHAEIAPSFTPDTHSN